MTDLENGAWACVNCDAVDPPIFLCDAGWWCEKCYREFSGADPDLPSDDLHDAINNGDALGLTEALKRRLYGEVEDE